MKPMTDTTTALALALEGAAAPAPGEIGEEIKRLSGVADMVGALPDPEIDERFVARLEATLMAEYDAQFGTAAEPQPRLQLVAPAPRKPEPDVGPVAAPNVITLPRRRFVVRKAIAAAVAAAMLSALPVLAAAHSLPGSPFFGIEKWRQNHAISSAHGAAQAFVMEDVARKWLGYATQMAALGYDAPAVEAALAHAGALQARATRLLQRVGTPAEITRLANMLKVDATRLREILPVASAELRPAVQEAIDGIDDLTRRLVDVLGVTLRSGLIPAAGTVDVADATAGSDPATVTGESGTSRQTETKPANEQPADEEITETSREYVDTSRTTACETIGREQLNDLLVAPSALMCDVRDTNAEASASGGKIE